MPTYLTPGVYIEEIPSSVRPIEAVGTSTAAFVGFLRRGPIGRERLVSSFDDYVQQFGGIAPGSPVDAMGHSIAAFFANGGSRAYVVRLAEGATPATGILVHPDAPDPANPRPEDRLIVFSAADPGTWGAGLRARLVATGGDVFELIVDQERRPAPGLPVRFVEVERLPGLTLDDGPGGLTGVLAARSRFLRAELAAAAGHMRGTSVSEEIPADLDVTSLNDGRLQIAVNGATRDVAFAADEFAAGDSLADVAAALVRLVRGGAQANVAVRDFEAGADGRVLRLRSGLGAADSFVRVLPGDQRDAAAPLRLGAANGGEERTGAEVLGARLATVQDGPVAVLSGGADGGPADRDDHQAVWARFLKVRDIDIICLPGQSYTGAGRSLFDDAIAHAQTAQRRMVIVDPPPGQVLTTQAEVDALQLPTSPWAAVYYPWVRVANPEHDPDTNPTAPATVLVPPSGFAAGMWSRIDARRGVWKAPAGTEASLLGTLGLEFVVEDAEQRVLNPAGVNALRTFPVFGTVVWGSRTAATNAQPEWRYIPVRRTAMFIEGSILNGIQWAVFEPNDHRLWSSLRINIEAFMDGLHRAGAFQGATARDAYFVRCGLGDTMTQADIDRGQVIVLVGFAPLKPAEFVIVRIQQAVGQQ